MTPRKICVTPDWSGVRNIARALSVPKKVQKGEMLKHAQNCRFEVGVVNNEICGNVGVEKEHIADEK